MCSRFAGPGHGRAVTMVLKRRSRRAATDTPPHLGLRIRQPGDFIRRFERNVVHSNITVPYGTFLNFNGTLTPVT